MSISASSRTFAPAAASLSRPQGMASMRAFAGACAALRAWHARARERARERAELAVMDARECRDLPHARDFDIRREIAKPFWRA